MFVNTINQYEYVIACIGKYNEIVAAEGVADIKKVVKSLKGNVKEIKKYRDIYMQNKQNNIAQQKLYSELSFDNKYFSTTNRECIDVVNVK